MQRSERHAREGRILAASSETLLNAGCYRYRVEDVARGAGVAKGTVYIDFATKQQLFEAMVTHACAIIQDALAKDPSIATSENSPCEMLARSVRQVISAAAHDPAVFLFLEGRLSCATSWLSGVVDAQLPLLEGLSDLIAQAQRNGEIRSDLMPSIGAHLALFPLSIPSLRDLVLDGQIDEASKQTVAMLGCGMA